MKIVHYISRVRLSIGGTVRAALDMCTAMSNRGHEVVLATTDATDAARGLSSEGARPAVVELPSGRGALKRWGTADLAMVREVLRGADAAHIHAIWAPTNPQFARACERAGVPYVVTAHGMLDDWSMAQKAMKKRVFLALSGNRMLREASSTHFTASEEMRQSRPRLPRDTAVSIPLLFDAGEYETLPGERAARAKFGLEDESRPIVLFLSRLTPGKRADLVISAARVLRDKGVDALTVIAGSGDASEEDRLRRLAESEGLRDRVRFVGAVFDAEKVSLYECASVFVLPSDHENFCFALVEAMAAGAPAVTVRTIAIWEELVESGGAVVAPPEAGAIAEAVASILTTGGRSRMMGERARRYILDEMSETRVAPRYEQMYLDSKEGV
jgi:glycosyltransferase involved in cell wall biosynthesis